MSERKGIIPLSPMRLRSVKRDDVLVWEGECPTCGVWGELDDDQIAGRVSIQCPKEGCFHETLNLRAQLDEWAAPSRSHGQEGE